MFKKIWNDPVGSKVIAGIILSIGGYACLALYGLVKDISIIDILSYPIPLGYFLLSILIICLLVISFTRVKKYLSSIIIKEPKLEVIKQKPVERRTITMKNIKAEIKPDYYDMNHGDPEARAKMYKEYKENGEIYKNMSMEEYRKRNNL